MTAYEETLHVNPEKNFEELNNEFAKVKLSEKLAYLCLMMMIFL